jgi:hypothetical protein
MGSGIGTILGTSANISSLNTGTTSTFASTTTTIASTLSTIAPTTTDKTTSSTSIMTSSTTDPEANLMVLEPAIDLVRGGSQSRNFKNCPMESEKSRNNFADFMHYSIAVQTNFLCYGNVTKRDVSFNKAIAQEFSALAETLRKDNPRTTTMMTTSTAHPDAVFYLAKDFVHGVSLARTVQNCPNRNQETRANFAVEVAYLLGFQTNYICYGNMDKQDNSLNKVIAQEFFSIVETLKKENNH